MTIKECIDAVDSLKPNQYTLRDKVQWLSSVDEGIINDVLKTHEGYDGRYDDFTGYTEDNLALPLIVQSPYDRLYTAFLEMKIDLENREMPRYNNSASVYNSYMMEYRKYYNKTHMPLSTTDRREALPPKKQSVGLSEIEFENLKRILFHMLSELFANMTSRDKLYDIVTEFAQNNLELLKGKDGTVEFANLTAEQIESLRGKAFTYEDFTPEQLEALKGKQGDIGVSGVYVGSGDMPEGYNVQIDPNGESFEVYSRDEIDEMMGNISSQIRAIEDYLGITGG
jgi:hypothetical protein